MTELCTMEDMLSTLEDDISHRTGRALKQRREAAGLSLRMLAERSGISSSMISDIERGAKSPTVVTVVRLAQALGVGAAALLLRWRYCGDCGCCRACCNQSINQSINQ